MSDTAIVVGGGLAGLAAAVSLVERGVAVALFESRPRLGGRASSIVDRETGRTIDNCQHVAMGCCTNFLNFCETIGISEDFHCETELCFIGPASDSRNQAISKFRSSCFPAPFHLVPSFLKNRFLSWQNKKAIAKGLCRLIRTAPQPGQKQTFADWLTEQNQSSRAIERFWKVVLVSALSESLDHISVRYARKVFCDAFLTNRDGWTVYRPTKPLDVLYGTRLVQWLEERGATIHLGRKVQKIYINESVVQSVELANGTRRSADHFILAVPHYLVLSLLPDPWSEEPYFSKTAQIQSAPIASVHLWFDRPITPLPHAVLIERLSQWLFNHSTTKMRPNCPDDLTPSDSRCAVSQTEWQDAHYYQIVISAAQSLANRLQEDVIREVVGELESIWPESFPATLRHARLITEHRAVFSARPGVDALRPVQQSPISNLQLAGDWTKTDWPSTMESAVRSGYLAAENVLALAGQPERLLQADSPCSFFSRIILPRTFGTSQS